MPKIRRHHLPPALFDHLLDRIRLREISTGQLGLLATWLDRAPDVPDGPWFKRFPEMTVCGNGELVKIILLREQTPFGQEIE